MLTLRLVHNDWRVFIDERDTGPATPTEVALWQRIAAVEAEIDAEHEQDEETDQEELPL